MLSATSEQYSKAIRRSGTALSIALLVQITLGIYTVKLGTLVWLDLAHSVMAAILMLPLIAISFYSKHGFTDSATISQKQAPIVESTDSVYLRLKSQLQKTRNGLGNVLTRLPLTQKNISEELLEEIEESLLLADIGIEATTDIIDKLTDNLDRDELNDSVALFAALKQDLLDMLAPCSQPLQIPQQDTPFVILVVGVNGAGKTTTIGKLAKKLQNQGHSVMLAAGDTFRAAAVEQLQVWGKRNNIPVVAQHTGADSASVIFDGLQSAKAKNIDVLIADTAGRLHTKSNLMEELKKIKRIMSKLDAAAPHEVLLVLDAGTGQNALSQAKLFNEAVALTGLALTKLDGTAKGGIIFALAKQMHIPIRYIGVGEGIDDLQEFNAALFVEALFVNE
jgi:fused signal recognition particle receptor